MKSIIFQASIASLPVAADSAPKENKPMTEKDIEILQDLAVTGNLTKTADRLYTTQSALTKRLQNMEAELGCRLFIRSKKGVLATPAAEKILPYVNSISEAMNNIRICTAALENEIAGTLRVGVAINYARYRLPQVLQQFMEKYPKVDIHVNVNRSPDLYHSLLNGDLNVALIRGDRLWTEGDIVISEEPICLTVSENVKFEDITALNNIPFIARETDAGYESELSRWMKENNLSPSSSLVINDVQTIVSMVELGIGWSVLPPIALGSFKGQFYPLSLKDGHRLLRRTHILYRPEYFQLPQVQAFIKAIQEAENYCLLPEIKA